MPVWQGKDWQSLVLLKGLWINPHLSPALTSPSYLPHFYFQN